MRRDEIQILIGIGIGRTISADKSNFPDNAWIK
jgi:hypothetical protein